MAPAKLSLLLGAGVGALLAYWLAGRLGRVGSGRAVAASIGAAIAAITFIGVSAALLRVPAPLPRFFGAGFVGVLATMMALSKVVLAPAKDGNYLRAGAYSLMTFVGCAGVALLFARWLW